MTQVLQPRCVVSDKNGNGLPTDLARCDNNNLDRVSLTSVSDVWSALWLKLLHVTQSPPPRQTSPTRNCRRGFKALQGNRFNVSVVVLHSHVGLRKHPVILDQTAARLRKSLGVFCFFFSARATKPECRRARSIVFQFVNRSKCQSFSRLCRGRTGSGNRSLLTFQVASPPGDSGANANSIYR